MSWGIRIGGGFWLRGVFLDGRIGGGYLEGKMNLGLLMMMGNG